MNVLFSCGKPVEKGVEKYTESRILCPLNASRSCILCPLNASGPRNL